MGKGDKKSKRGKIFKGTYGKRRPRKKQSDWVNVPKEKEKVKAKVEEKTKCRKD
ncbi:MAG: 30S ribosomal protein THX [Ignavibacteriaceae bacterium]